MKTRFEFAEHARDLREMTAGAREALGHSSDPKVRALVADLPSLNGERAMRPLSVAFVGQFDAGKSTLISALTGRRDIRISADVETDEVTAFDWNGVNILDTPGVHAGRPEHDEKTYSALFRADLVVFVITNELFDERIAQHFRRLAFEQSKSREMMLVVNKMAQDAGTPETKRTDIEQVIAPLKLEDLRTVFMDAHCWLDAEEAIDERDQRELEELSNFEGFVAALNDFVRDQGHLGRLTAPLHQTRSALQQAVRLGATDDGPERAALELLHRRKQLFFESRQRLRMAMQAAVEVAVAEISTAGDQVAECVEPGADEKTIQAEHDGGRERAEKHVNALAEQSSSIVSDELLRLDRELKALADGELAQAVGALARKKGSPDFRLEVERQHRVEAPHRGFAQAQRAADVAQKIGKYTSKLAFGEATEAAGFGGAMAARGGDLHKAVLAIGRFFGVRFKPWGAVNFAKALGNAGKVLGIIGGVVGVVAQVAEDNQQERYRVELRNARDELRTCYRDVAAALRTQFWNRFEEFSRGFYDAEIAEAEHQANELAGARKLRTGEAKALEVLLERSKQLLAAVQAAVGGSEKAEHVRAG